MSLQSVSSKFSFGAVIGGSHHHHESLGTLVPVVHNYLYHRTLSTITSSLQLYPLDARLLVVVWRTLIAHLLRLYTQYSS